MPSSDYQHRPGGSLKLKGGGAETKKKKKKSKSSTSQKLREEETAAAASGSGSDREVASSASASGSTANPYKTEAERRFEEVQRKRLLDKAAKQALKSHKERVAEFNEKLENMSEHYDIPKVGPG
ncbi:hypothetical protein C6P46_003946 [Rhodotorula mucilaginosa]|uniref:DUF1754-domain-containing protein n=1 Tax=Rhodotorula mucilaginosa TaxID=5537 RepID=A0A9P7B6T6_RHOMI|nr:hypothetical protein C6P46_003946 [Rhodotorula mucilaginosa]TKA54178.1 hypothetical protein B0A53_03555 [Rhodotorula sp. CCFEE 5036]